MKSFPPIDPDSFLTFFAEMSEKLLLLVACALGTKYDVPFLHLAELGLF